MKGSRITTEKSPTKYEVASFWKNIWRAPDKTFNENFSWLIELEMTHCSDVQPKQYEITKDTLKTAVNKIHLGKSPGRDWLIGHWLKKFTFYIESLASLYQYTLEGSTTLPDWLTPCKNNIVTKKWTYPAKNYPPIACLSLTYKLYKRCLNNFLEHHYRTNSIITTEQAGGKKGIWATTENY